MRKIFGWFKKLWYWYLYDYQTTNKKHQEFIVSLLKWDIERRWRKRKHVSDLSE
jgi:hypothetical protein